MDVGRCGRCKENNRVLEWGSCRDCRKIQTILMKPDKKMIHEYDEKAMDKAVNQLLFQLWQTHSLYEDRADALVQKKEFTKEIFSRILALEVLGMTNFDLADIGEYWFDHKKKQKEKSHEK